MARATPIRKSHWQKNNLSEKKRKPQQEVGEGRRQEWEEKKLVVRGIEFRVGWAPTRERGPLVCEEKTG